MLTLWFIKTDSDGYLQAFYTYNLQVKVFRKRHYVRKIFRGDVSSEFAKERRLGEGDSCFGCDFRNSLMFPADEEVGDVGAHSFVFFGGVVEEIVGDADVEVGTFGDFLFPFVVAVDVGEGYDGASAEDFDFVSELGFAADCHPDALRHKGGCDDGGFLRLDKGDRLVGVSVKEVFSEEALGQCPV